MCVFPTKAWAPTVLEVLNLNQGILVEKDVCLAPFEQRSVSAIVPEKTKVTGARVLASNAAAAVLAGFSAVAPLSALAITHLAGANYLQ